MSEPNATLGALVAHMRGWDGSAAEASTQAQLAADLVEQLRHRAAEAYRREARARVGIAAGATDDEIAEQAMQTRGAE